MTEKTEKKVFMLLGLAALAFLALTGNVPAALTGLVRNDSNNRPVNPHGTGAPVNGSGTNT